MCGDISIDIGDALPYYTEKLLKFFGKDVGTKTANERFMRMQHMGIERASFIQCVGMPDPIRLERLYQPSRLYTDVGTTTTVQDVVRSEKSAVIMAGPGRGKTTLLHWVFITTLRDETLPLLFTLRLPSAVEDLANLIGYLKEGTNIKGLKQKLLLLVDGYDEIDESERKLVSDSLSEFKTLHRGSFLLTCRSYYSVLDLFASQYNVAPFAPEDSERFVNTFASAIGVDIDGADFCRELIARGFDDFVGHPLMLALACVLRTGPLQSIPSNAIGLIRRALDTLTFRWDESKGIARDAALPVDGEVRQRCLMRVAFECVRLPAAKEAVEAHVRTQLSLEQCDAADPGRLLDEMAKWYGILIPTASGEWEFVHKSLHDYLAARYWVESGRFNPSSVERWSTRASYACCLVPDGTSGICCALRLTSGLSGLIECIYNRAAFDGHVVARALHRAFRDDNTLRLVVQKDSHRFSIAPEADFFGLAKTEFLHDLLVAPAEPSNGRLVLAAYCLAELNRRGKIIERKILPEYVKSLETFTVARRHGLQQVRLADCISRP